MLSNKEEKYIRSLQQSKYREKEKAFIAEGEKIIRDLVFSGMNPEFLLCVQDYLQEIAPDLPLNIRRKLRGIEENQLKKISTLKTPNKILAVFPIPDPIPLSKKLSKGLVLYLDGIRDPGNMGTILRIADWFGIAEVAGSPDCVEIYNPKVVQSSMGSLGRVSYRVLDEGHLQSLRGSRKVYGSTMEGENIYNMDLDSDGILVIGNEARGIREDMKELVDEWIAIPSYDAPSMNGNAESLNAAVATAVFCAEFKRRT